ncbi:MAG: hypothetical protein FWD12_01415, partial [Alphaproteobacteria bacterium]|nr:hypothetical protein [Alphaproteobacteria bacterium]
GSARGGAGFCSAGRAGGFACLAGSVFLLGFAALAAWAVGLPDFPLAAAADVWLLRLAAVAGGGLMLDTSCPSLTILFGRAAQGAGGVHWVYRISPENRCAGRTSAAGLIRLKRYSTP